MADFQTLLPFTFPFYPAIIPGAIASTILTYALYNLFFHPLSRIPGPIGVRLGLWSWKTTRAMKLDMGWKLLELHEKYGVVVRIARNEVSICDPSAIDQIYKFKSPLSKTRFYESMRGMDGSTLLSTVDNQKHAETRRAESSAYATKLLAAFEQNVDSCCDDLVGYLDRCIDAGKGTVDLSQILQLFAIDVIGELALGKSFGLCAIGEDTHKFLPMLVKFLELACLDGTQPMIGSLFRWLFPMLPEPPSARILTGIVRGRIDSRFQEYKEQGTNSNHRDMLYKLLSAQNSGGSEYSLEQVRAAVYVCILLTRLNLTTMRAMIRFVVGNSRIYRKVQEEIDHALSSGAITFPLSYSDVSALPYFQACFKETLRLHPAVPWTLSRSIGVGGATIAGHFFQEGTEVSMSPFVIHRRPEAYGDDVMIFRPERWIEADAEERRKMEHNNLAFGSGPRVCLGKAIGMMEVSKAMVLLFWKYRIKFTPRSATSPHKHKVGRAVDGRTSSSEPYFVTSQWVAVQSDFWCDLSRRTGPKM
ncbi:cytochrome P450 oxidoreductase [Mycena latifolia]|nr:cytochrome P450 oxidoreductase [Mycena latifolia]